MLSLSFIAEEGLSQSELSQIADSVQKAAQKAGVGNRRRRHQGGSSRQRR